MFIYGLYSTEDNTIRYVGKTKYVLSKRLREHINGALLRNCQTHKDNWIRQTYRNGHKVEIKLIEECDDTIWKEREKYWISNINRLTNSTPGGEGGHGNIYTVTYNEMKEYLMTYSIPITSKTKFVSHRHEFEEKYPRNPKEVFTIRGEWISWGDFLNTSRIQDNKKVDKYLTFNKAKQYINRFIKPRTSVEYRSYIKEHHIDFLPAKPFRFYSDKGWNGWEDYLGVNRIYEITDELIFRYLRRYHPNVTSNHTFRKNKWCIHRAIHLGRIQNFDFTKLRTFK